MINIKLAHCFHGRDIIRNRNCSYLRVYLNIFIEGFFFLIEAILVNVAVFPLKRRWSIFSNLQEEKEQNKKTMKFQILSSTCWVVQTRMTIQLLCLKEETAKMICPPVLKNESRVRTQRD